MDRTESARAMRPAEDTGDRAHLDGTPERWSRTLIDSVADLVAVVDASGLLLYANAAAETVLGYAPTAQVGSNIFEFVHPDDLDSVVASFLETVATSETQPATTFRMRSAEGEWRHVETTATNCLADPSVAGVVVNVRDVSDRLRAEVRADRLARMYRTLVQANQAMAVAADVASMLKSACDIVVQDGDFGLAWVGLLDGDDVLPVASAGEPIDYVESLRISVGDALPGPTASAIIEDRPATAANESDPSIAQWRDQFVAAGLASSCAVPLRQRDVVIGALNVYSRSPEFFDDNEIGLLVELAADLALGLDRLALEAERATADELLRRSEARFRALVQGSTDAVFVLSPARTMSFITAAVTAITGWPPDHYLGTDALAWVHPDDRHVAVAALDAAHPDQEPSRWQVRIAHCDGGWRWVEATATDMVDVPEIGGIVVNFRDVTTERGAQEEIRFHARLLEAVGEAVIATDPLGHILYWNDAAALMYGWSSEEVSGQLIADVTPAGGSTPDATEILEALGRGESWAGVSTVRRRDGSEFEAMVTGSPFYDETGGLTGIIGTALDVTEREAVNRQLREAHDLLRRATDSMAEGMFALDSDGRATLVNRAAADLFGGSVEDLVGESLHDLTHFERADGSPSSVDDCPILAARTVDQVVRIDRDTFVRLDGTPFPVSYVASPLHAASGGIRGCVVLFRDITTDLVEELRAHEALEKLSWIGRIQDALDDDRFVLFAQPILDLDSGVVTKHELLLRLQTREGDHVLPGSFLPTAEEFGLVKQIDRWVIAQACAIAAMGHSVSFNLSGVSLDDPATLAALVAALDATGATPENLTCEITETALMRHGASGEQLVRSIRALGCGIALDDFGVGFGGFAYLKSLPVTAVKIDKQFVSDALDEPASSHVIQAIVSLARAFGLETIAEGAESTQTVDLIRDLGVDAIQGFVVGHPVSAHHVFGPLPGTGRQRDPGS
ncbi:MAG TPA: PAS domain S-box protein [Ilumatobacteraceae bacterium]|nr:PAS domain S-box protein [Ilumatobacteraceae bacterium]